MLFSFCPLRFGGNNKLQKMDDDIKNAFGDSVMRLLSSRRLIQEKSEGVLILRDKLVVPWKKWEEFAETLTVDFKDGRVIDSFHAFIKRLKAEQLLMEEEKTKKTKKTSTKKKTKVQMTMKTKCEQEKNANVENDDDNVKVMDAVVNPPTNDPSLIDTSDDSIRTLVVLMNNEWQQKFDAAQRLILQAFHEIEELKRFVERKNHRTERKVTAVYEILARPELRLKIETDLGCSINDCRPRLFVQGLDDGQCELGFQALTKLVGTEFDSTRKQLKCSESIRALDPMTPSIEINFWVTMGEEYAIVEGTMSHLLSDDAALAAKLLQLERQVVFANGMMGKAPRFVGLVSTSFPDDCGTQQLALGRIKKFIRDSRYSCAVPEVLKFLQGNQFRCYKFGPLAELP